MNRCDIIIPTYNGAKTLGGVLESIAQQTFPQGWSLQVLVCDDGSTDNTAGVVEGFSKRLPIKYLYGKHGGAAVARNRGIDASGALIIFFLGDDMVLRPGSLASHFSFHDAHPEARAAALGVVMWDPRLYPTPLMEWMTHAGPQNDFDSLLGGENIDPAKYFYGSHVSIKRSSLGSERFSLAYQGYGYEDIDLGRRLSQAGLMLTLLEDARGLHNHMYDVASIRLRQFRVGMNSKVFYGKKEIKKHIKFRHRVQVMLYAIGVGAVLRFIVSFFAKRYSCPRLFAHYVNYEYRRGVLHSEHMTYPQAFPQ